MPDNTTQPKVLSKSHPSTMEVDTNNPLEQIILSPQEVGNVVVSATTRTFISSIPGYGKILEWTERVEQESREIKLQVLFREYSSKFETIEEALSRLQILHTTLGGQTVFRKIIQIISKGEENQEWITLLARVLKSVSEPELEKHFEERVFVLSQIDRLSSQALLLLDKYEIWRQANIDGTTTTSGQTAGDWIPKATRFLMSKIGIHDLPLGARVNHSFHELESAGIVSLQGHQLKLTAIGLEIQRAITFK